MLNHTYDSYSYTFLNKLCVIGRNRYIMEGLVILTNQSINQIKLSARWIVLKVVKDKFTFLNRILDLAWPTLMKLTLEQQYALCVLHSQYHACWCTGDFRSQCISRHGTMYWPHKAGIFRLQHQKILQQSKVKDAFTSVNKCTLSYPATRC